MDKNKIIEGAAKLVAKGAYDKAIKEYQRVLEADPKDVRVLQKMGELYQKKNDVAQAAQYFTKVAESYAQDGFFLKAVALYKQVLKLSPSLVEVNLKLAELHVQLQLLSEATAYYQILANHYDKQGNVKASLGTLKKMVDLDPDNASSRIKLAELYAREGMNKEAVSELRHAAEYLKRNNRQDDYLRVFERIASLDPSDLRLTRELAVSHIQRRDYKRALASLQVLFKADGRDEQTLTLLAEAFIGLGQTQKTVSVYKELAKVVSEKGRAEEANRLWAKIEQLDPRDPDLLAKKTSKPSSATSPPRPPAPATPASKAPPALADAPGFTTTGGTPTALSKLLTETDVYVKYGLHDKALEHLRRIFSVDSENLDAHEKAYQVYVSAKNYAQASEQLLNVLRLCVRRREVQRAQPYLATLLKENPGHPEASAFIAALRTDGSSASEDDEPILMDSDEEEIQVGEAPEDALLGPARKKVAPPRPVEEGEEIEVEPAAEDGPWAEDAALQAAAAEEDDGQVVAVPTEGHELPWPQSPVDPEPSEERTVIGINPLAFPADHAQGGEESPGPAEELPVAEDELSQTSEPRAEIPVEAPSGVEAAPAGEDPAAEECDEAAFFLEQGLKDEALEVLQTVLLAWPGHPRAMALMAKLEPMEEAAETSASDESLSFDLAAEVEEELGSPTEEEPTPSSADDFQYSMEEVFSEFKKGLEKVVKPEDVETHYDLGIAYKEMGLLDDALKEMDVARKGCVGKRKELDCLSMRALLLSLKGDHRQAVSALKEALSLPHADADAQKALLYDLAATWRQLGAPGKALFVLQKIQALEAGYRDVDALVAELRQSAKPEEDQWGEKPKDAARPSAARKVGYL